MSYKNLLSDILLVHIELNVQLFPHSCNVSCPIINPRVVGLCVSVYHLDRNLGECFVLLLVELLKKMCYC